MATTPTSPQNESYLHTDLDFNSFILEAEQVLKVDDDTPRQPANTGASAVETTTSGQEEKELMQTASNIFNKMDDEGQGFITHDMLRRYTKRELQKASPTTVFNEDDFLAGFDKIDRDSDGRITF